jgi:hypothetical protein
MAPRHGDAKHHKWGGGGSGAVRPLAHAQNRDQIAKSPAAFSSSSTWAFSAVTVGEGGRGPLETTTLLPSSIPEDGSLPLSESRVA